MEGLLVFFILICWVSLKRQVCSVISVNIHVHVMFN